MSGRLLILSGPSGVGKDTVIDAWHAADPRVARVISYTTRPPREKEVDGIDYHFVSRERFEALALDGAFLEHKEVYGNYYATPLHDLEAMLAEGKIAVLKIDVQGALTVMDLRPEATTIFLYPPDLEELERRIRARGTDDPVAIERRLATAREEIALAIRYQHQIVNDSVESVVAQLLEIASA